MPNRSLETMLTEDRNRLVDFIAWKAGAPLLRFESVEDLVQGVHLEALRAADRFEWQGEEAFLGWINRIATRHLAGRRDHWFALKRNCGALLRLTWGNQRANSAGIAGRSSGGVSGGVSGGGGRGVRQLADSATGPVTFAFRREQLVLATRALALLLPRDRTIINWTTHGVPLETQAARLGITCDAAERARSRAIERLRKTFALVSSSPAPEAAL